MKLVADTVHGVYYVHNIGDINPQAYEKITYYDREEHFYDCLPEVEDGELAVCLVEANDSYFSKKWLLKIQQEYFINNTVNQ